jgi:PadR family transcriptional regulator PadR
MEKHNPDRIELLQGTLDMLILRTQLFGPSHGHQIGKHIQRTTNDLLQVQHGSLYPALHRLQRKGWVISKWEDLFRPQPGIQVLPADGRWEETTSG